MFAKNICQPISALEMKRIITVILVFLSIHINVQNLKYLHDIASNDGIPIGKAIIYGNFHSTIGV